MKEGRIFKDKAKRMIDLSFWVGLFFFGLFLAISPLSARAAINEQLQFSGKLTNSNKTNVANGSYNFKFELYQASSGGSAVWTETWNNSSGRISVTDGLFSVSLGSHTSLSGVDFNSSSIYLQVYFDPGNDGTYEESFSTRIRLTSAPYAFNAGKLGGKEESTFGTLADDESVAGSWQFNEQLRFGDSDASNYVGFKAPAAVGTNVVWTLPSADGAAGQYLKTDGSGTLSWAAGAGGGASAVADLTDVNLTSLGDNELLQYDSASSKWINQTLAEAGIQSSLTLGDLSGTSNQVTVTGGTGAIIGSGVTLSLPQNIHTAATPTFAGLTLGSLNGVLKASSGTISGSATTSDLTEGSNLYFTEERTDDRVSSLIQNGTGLTWTYVDASNTLTGNVSLAGFNVDDLGDVIVTAVADNEVLTYDSASSKWINQTAAEAGLSVVGHTHTAGDITDFSTEVASNADVAANTAARHSAATIADSATIDFTLTGQQISGSVIQSGLDHGSIGGLTDDDHTIYALLAGRAGGQTLYGGTGAGDDLTLLTTSNATKGSYILGDLTTNGLLKTTGGTGTLAVATADTDYQQVITWGDGLEYATGTAAVDYNTTNLKITATELNTIQDIATSASPTFAGLALGSGNLTMTGSLGATGARLTKGWFTDLEVTNAIAGSITGNAATVTTNANLTGPITSVGNATSVASQTGTGSTFVMNTSPTLVTPTIGAATATSIAIGANTINTSEWANLDGLNQTVATTSSPTFASLNLSASTNQVVMQSGGVTGTLTWTPTTIGKTITLPDASGTVAVSASGALSLSAAGALTIADAAADGSTKGAASFTAADFDASSGNISIDYTNGQAASGSTKGFLTAADWTTFNNKLGTGTTLFTLAGTSGDNQTITSGNTVTLAAGTDITTTGGATDTVTIANSSTLASVTGRGATTTTSVALNGGITVDTSNFTVDGSTGAVVTASTLQVAGETDITKVNAAGGSADALTLSGTLGAMDGTGTDIFRGAYLNYVNADHTGGSFYGLDIAGITADAQATERAINIGAGWDVGLYIADATTYSLQFASTDGDAASGITFGTDTNLYRSAADTLKTDDNFISAQQIQAQGFLANRTNTDDPLIAGQITTDTHNRFSIDVSGLMTWGSGSAGRDTTLYRSAADTLKTDDSFVAANLTSAGLTSGRVTYAGTAGILQDSANMTFGATYGLTLAAGSTSALQLSSTAGTAVGGILFGTDTTLYRSAASILKTDDALTAAGDITSESRVIATRATDADQGLLALVTGDPEARFMVTAGGVINFGDGTNTRDTNLYRSAANTLKTDDSFTVTGTTTLATSLSGLLKAASGVVSAGVADTDYQQVITWGDGLEYATGTAAVDYNTTNLKITSTELNTIQDIATTSSPSFVGITASGSAALNGGITVDTTNFTVDGTTGAVVTASTLQVGSTANLNGGIAVDTSNFTVSGTTGATAIAAVNSAGSSLNALALSGTLGAMDGTGTDIFRGVYLNYTNANHTGGSFYGLDIAGITADAQATERAVNIGTGWDVGAYIADAATYSLQLASTDGDAASGITFGTDTNLYRSAADTLKTDDSFEVAGHTTFEGVTSTGATGTGKLVYDTSPLLVTPTIGTATATAISIGANTLNTTEWAFLDGQDQAVKTTSTPQFTKIGLGSAVSSTAAVTLGTGYNNVGQLLNIYENGNYRSGLGMDGGSVMMRIYGSGATSNTLSLGQISTDGNFTYTEHSLFTSGGQLQLLNNDVNSGLLLGGDTGLYRDADSQLLVITAPVMAGEQGGIHMGDNSDGSMWLKWGNAGTRVYRLQTAPRNNGDVGYAMEISSNAYWDGDSFERDNPVPNSVRYRFHEDGLSVFGADAGAGTISTWDTYAVLGKSLSLPTSGTTGGIVLGDDTNLYRSAANTLKTDDNLVVSLSYISNKADSAGTSQFLFNTSAAISSATLFAVQNNGTNKFLIGPTGTITDLQTYSDTVGVTNRDLYVDNTGKFGYVSSSARYKKDIVGLNDNDTDWLYNLRPVSFEYIDPAQSGTQLGLIAEEVEQVYQPLVSYSIDDPTQPETVSYSKLVVPLLNEVQNLNESVKEAIAALANKQDLIGDSLALNTLTASNITTSSGNLTLSANEGVVKVADSLEVDGAVIFHNNLEVKGTIAGASIDLGDQTSGQAAVSKNTNEVFVASQVVKPADKIILTPVFDDSLANNNIQLFKGQVEENSGFYVKAITSQPLTEDLLFDWVIIK